jgi:hypothetical protein
VVVAALIGCGWRGKMSSERTLSSTSIWELSVVELVVAELQEINRPMASSTKTAQTLRPMTGYQPSLPTRTIFPPFYLPVRTRGLLVTIHPVRPA